MYVALGIPGRAPLLYLIGAAEDAGGLSASGVVVRYPVPRARTLRVMTKTKTGWAIRRGAGRFDVPRCPTPGHFLTTALRLPRKERAP